MNNRIGPVVQQVWNEGSGRGKAVASDTRGHQFKSSHWQNFIINILTVQFVTRVLVNKSTNVNFFFANLWWATAFYLKKMSKCAKMFCVNPTKWFFVWKYCKRQNCRETNFCPKKLWTRVDLINFEFPFGIDRFEIYIFVVKIDDNDDNQKKFIKRSFQKSLKNLTSHDLFVRWGDDELKVVIIIQRY